MAMATWIKGSGGSQIHDTIKTYLRERTRICINWNHPFRTQSYFVKVPLNVNIAKQDLLHKNSFRKLYEGGILTDADSGPHRHVLWCYCGISHQPDTFIQIGSGYTVNVAKKGKNPLWQKSGYILTF